MKYEISNATILIDKEDEERLDSVLWVKKDSSVTAHTSTRGGAFSLGRYLLDIPENVKGEVCFKTRNDLDFRKANLSFNPDNKKYIRSDRKAPKSGFYGVHEYLTRCTKDLRYRAYLNINGKRKEKGGFLTAKKAGKHYNKMVKEAGLENIRELNTF
ncbi:hypothetical protein P0Y35_11700 [Kiritimatiellaeota bacterium B1221]|nr:hypothetical protein [Kiritimatiellaeota bacterium B1221]